MRDDDPPPGTMSAAVRDLHVALRALSREIWAVLLPAIDALMGTPRRWLVTFLAIMAVLGPVGYLSAGFTGLLAVLLAVWLLWLIVPVLLSWEEGDDA